jgi:hypothetical protein
MKASKLAKRATARRLTHYLKGRHPKGHNQTTSFAPQTEREERLMDEILHNKQVGKTAITPEARESGRRAEHFGKDVFRLKRQLEALPAMRQRMRRTAGQEL